MSTGFVPLDALVAKLSPDDQEFYSNVIKRDTQEHQNGTDKAGILARMQCDQCQDCISNFRIKHPGKQFAIRCVGIYDTPDYERLRAEMLADGDDMSLEEIQEVYDPSFWGTRHMVTKDDQGNVVPFSPRTYQEKILRCTSPRKVDRLGRGMGKALALDTPIPTPDGWTTMDDLHPGDRVFDENGKACNVTFVTGVMKDRICYDVVFSDGSVIVADAEHLWETWTKDVRKAKGRQRDPSTVSIHQPEVVTTEQIRQTLTVGKKNETNHSIPVCGALQYPAQALAVDPYVLGAWLGDGSKDSANLTTADAEILDEFEAAGTVCNKVADKYGYSFGTKPSQRNPKTGSFMANGSAFSDLKALGVIRNKHVPRPYMESPVKQRIALLQGLMDTGGDIEKNGWASFNNTNLRLANAVLELVTGLGMKPSWCEHRAVLNGKDCGPSYRVGFFPTIDVFRLPRKLNRQQPARRPTVGRRYIVEVRERESVPVKCIQVDSPKHLYLAGHACIPTHNTMAGVVEEMHFLCNNKNTYTLVVAPAQNQAVLWWDEINFQIDNSPTKEFEVIQKKQQPYFYIRFANGSVIGIFTAGSKSGKGADSVRSQSPRRIRLEEQDFLADKDYQAIMPLLRRFKNVTFHGSSTPTGKREMYWQMCNKFADYKEFYHPIMEHPDWGTDTMNEMVCLAEAKTMDRYRHEWLAEFGDPSAGIFKNAFVTDAMRPYGFGSCMHDAAKRYVMGIDWNGKGTGTRIVITEYNPATRKRKVVHHEAVDDPKATTQKSFDRIVDLNRMWHCDHVYIDAGFGFVQDELLREIGTQAGNFDPDTARLKHLHVIDFGAKLETNAIVPNRDPDSKYLANPKDDLLQKRTKPFMVEGAVQAFEMGLVEISREYTLLEEQLRGYRVKTWTKGGAPDTYATDSETGDHDLDAFMLSLLGIELNYGLWHTQETVRRLIQIAHVSGWGLPSSAYQSANPLAQTTPEPVGVSEQVRSLKREASGVPARNKAEQLGQKAQQDWRMMHLMRNGYMTAPNGPTGRAQSRVPSRTGMFQNATRSNPTGTRFGRS